MGSAAAFHLASRGLRVLALERHGLAHELGSSHGLTRIIRLAYFEHPAYVPLLRRSYVLWRDLQDRARERLLHVTGGLDVGREGSEIVAGSLRSCEIHGLTHQVLTSRELSRRFPAWRLPESAVAVLQPDAGFLIPERCIQVHAEAAVGLGAEVHEHEAALEWTPAVGGVRVRTTLATYEAEQLVISAGPWVGKLVPELAPLLFPERQVLGWFATRHAALFAPTRFPVFMLDVAEGQFYGFPVHGVAGFKIGKWHHLRERIDPDVMDRDTHPSDEAILREAVARYLPGANGPLLRSKPCIFTNTPDEHFIIDRHPVYSQVLVVSPCSGHGFKFCSVVGEIVADLVESGRTAHDISLFRVSRFRA